MSVLPDPIREAVAAYRQGLADFNAYSGGKDITDDDRDAYAAISYAPPLHVLDGWSQPATTLQGALDGIRMAHDEALEDCAPYEPTMIPRLLAAALAYLDVHSEHASGRLGLSGLNQVEIEAGVTVADLHDRTSLCAALTKLEVDVLEIKSQLQNPSEAQLTDSSWQIRAQDALRWKKRGLAAIRYRLSQIREANREVSQAAQQAAAGDDSERELLRLATEWCAACDACNATPGDVGPEDPNIAVMERLEERAAAIQPRTRVGFATKVLILSAYGGNSLAEWGEVLTEDACRLAASAPWPASRSRPEHAREKLEGA